MNANQSHDQLSAVLWDMDGTVIDTEPYWMRAEHALVDECGGSWSDELGLSLVGNDLTVSAKVLQNQGVDLDVLTIVDRLQSDVAQQVKEEPLWRPGATELLAECRSLGMATALVTMSWTLLAEAVVAELPSDSFDVIVTGDRVEQGKPEPDAYLLACKELGVEPSRCVAIEDSPTGMKAAVAAGVPTVGVRHLVDLPSLPGSVVIDSLSGMSLADLTALAHEIRGAS